MTKAKLYGIAGWSLVAAFFVAFVASLVAIVLAPDHSGQFEDRCRADGYFLDLDDGVINCIDGSKHIVRQYRY